MRTRSAANPANADDAAWSVSRTHRKTSIASGTESAMTATKRKAAEVLDTGSTGLRSTASKRVRVPMENQNDAVVVAASNVNASQDPVAGPSRSPSRSTSPRGRGRGRGFGRGRGRPGFGRGGAGGNAPGGGRLQEISRDPSPSDSMLVKLRHRQRQLTAVFRAIVPFHTSALEIISDRTQAVLRSKKNAHKEVPEHGDVKEALEQYLARRTDEIESEYEFMKGYLEQKHAREKARVIKMCNAKVEHLHEEHQLGSQGDYMALMERARGAEDDAVTEVVLDSTNLPREHQRKLHSLPREPFESLYRPRGFNAPFIPRPHLLRKAAEEFDTSTRKEILIEEIVPLIRQSGKETAEAQRRLTADSIALATMLEAGSFLMQQKASPSHYPPPQAPQPSQHDTLLLEHLADTALVDAKITRYRPLPARPPSVSQPISPAQRQHRPSRGRKSAVRSAPRTIAPAPTFTVAPLAASGRAVLAVPPINSLQKQQYQQCQQQQQQQYQQIMPAPPFHHQPALSVPRNPTPRAPRALLPAPSAGPVQYGGGNQGM